MEYKRYQTYKDSGVEWLGEVPEHWDVGQLRRVTRFEYGDSLAADDRKEGKVAVYGSNGAVGAHSVANTRGPCIVVGRKGSFGKLNYSEEPVFAIDTTYYIDGRHSASDLRWLYYVMQPLGLDECSKDSAVPGLGREEAYEQLVAIPKIDEQAGIASYLNHETTRIDTLIEKKQRLIELLKEKRQAVITQAVTKGLDPNVPMKDSGVEWLGEVPGHWGAVALGYRYEVVLGKMLDQKRVTGEHLSPYLRNVDVQWDRINTDDLPEMDFSGPDLAKYALRAGDLLVCEGGDVGRCAIWYGEAEQVYYQKALHRLRPYEPKKDNPRFLMYVLWNASAQGRFISGGGKATIAHLTAESLRRYVFVFPKRTEQDTIVSYLDGLRGKYEAIINKTEASILLLQEHRSALITAAVTGQIDVRNIA